MFSIEIDKEIQRHALEEYPRECCGIVLNGGIYLRLQNVDPDPETGFMFRDEDVMQHLATGRLRAIVHSHPRGPNYPTREDMIRQQKTGVAWGIVSLPERKVEKPFWFGDTVPVAPYVGRDFRHGVSDCYALFRDWYREELKIQLGVYPRDHEWWNAGQNMFHEFYANEGFVDFSLEQIKPGDGILFSIGPKKIMNHIGVYLGNGTVLHHLHSRLSRHDPLQMWSKHVTKVIRHKSMIGKDVA